MKSEAPAEITKAIRQITEGGVYVSPQMNAQLLKRLSAARSSDAPSGVDSLTDRELEVFQFIGKGRNAREIAESLGLGESTVETYRARIKDKLGLRNAAELYQRAAQWLVEKGG
jgi:DNA-binding NarL/FixJ family response regulator